MYFAFYIIVNLRYYLIVNTNNVNFKYTLVLHSKTNLNQKKSNIKNDIIQQIINILFFKKM